MATTEKQELWVIERLPDALHYLVIRGNADEQAVYQNVYAAIWNEGGKHAEVLPAMFDAALAMMAVVGAQECCCDDLGPRPDGTNAIAMVALQMYRFLAAIRDGNAEAATMVRRRGEMRREINGKESHEPGNSYTCEPDYSPCVPDGYRAVASAIAAAVSEQIFGHGIDDQAS